jgi:hypothetical protein
MREDARLGLWSDDELLAALRDAFEGESGAVTVDVAFVERVRRRCRQARRRSLGIRLAAPALVAVALAAMFAGRGLPSGPVASYRADPGRAASSMRLTGPPIELAGFKVPTPEHYTPTTRPCGLRATAVFAVSDGDSACLQGILVSRAELRFPADVRWLAVGPHKAALVHDAARGFTKLAIIFPASTHFRLIVLSAKSMSDRELVWLANRITMPGTRNTRGLSYVSPKRR